MEKPPQSSKWSTFKKEAIGFWIWIGKRWKWDSILSVGAIGMIKLGEYGIGLAMLVVAALAAVSRISQWDGSISQRMGGQAIKVLGYCMVFVMLSLLCLITYRVKGDSPWSNLLPKTQPVAALTLHAVYVGIRNMPERNSVSTWNDKPWDEEDYADVRLTITNALDLPLQNLDLDINVTDGDSKAGIAGIAQLTNISGVEFRKPPFQVPEPALRLRGNDGKSYNLPFPGIDFLEAHRIVPNYGFFCPRLGHRDIIRLILATIHVGDHNRPPDRLKITGTYLTESAEGMRSGRISETIATIK